MSLIRNEVNGRCRRGTCIKFVWANIGENFFDPSYVSKERRYQIITYRHRYKVLKLMNINKFWMVFKIMLYCCSICSYLIHTHELNFNIFLLRWDMIDQKFFPDDCPYKFLCKSPNYSVHFIFLTSLWITLIHCNKKPHNSKIQSHKYWRGASIGYNNISIYKARPITTRLLI